MRFSGWLDLLAAIAVMRIGLSLKARMWPAWIALRGAADRYARLFLHYVHGLTRRHLRVQTFTFGTRLTCITRSLRHRDPDEALQRADAQVRDWKGGTRIAACLHQAT